MASAGGEAMSQGGRDDMGSWRDPNVVYLVSLFIAIKVGLLIVMLLGGQLLPFNSGLYDPETVTAVHGLPDFLRVFATWDTQQYLLLAGQGYGTHAGSDAFYPLYPMIIRLLTPLFAGNALVAAWVIANAISLLVPVYLYRLSRMFWPAVQSTKIVLLLLAFPTAFFLSMAYSESLYLVLCLAAFYYLLRKDVLTASVLCFWLPLVRAQALLFIVPILVLFLETAMARGGSWREAARLYLMPAVATLAGVGAYFLFFLWQLGDPFAGFKAQSYFAGDNSIAHLFDPVGWFSRNFLELQPALHGYNNSLLDRGAFLIALPLLIGVWRTQHKALAAYATVALLVPALAGTFMSFTRHLLLVFPLVMYLGTRFKHAELIAAPMFALQILLLMMHTGSYWVA